MILKHPDDKQPDLALLRSLLIHPAADEAKKKRIDLEMKKIQAGIRGEAEAAYEMQVLYGQADNWAVIHDLRIETGGVVAQIDHLIINSWLDMWVCESKNFSEGVGINEHGEFAAFFGGRPHGVPSPVEQNNRHMLLLSRLFDSGQIKLPTRLGFTLRPALKSLVLVSKGARISRPKTKIAGLEVIIKNDMLRKTIDADVENASALLVAKVVSAETLRNLGMQLTQMHRPVKYNWHAKFGLPEVVVPSPSVQPIRLVAEHAGVAARTEQHTPQPDRSNEPHTRPQMACHNCQQPITNNVARFCLSNKHRYGGKLYCMRCQ